MREIKFRAWDNVKNKMMYAYHFIDFEQKLFGFASGVHHHYINLMQYTGLKDKKEVGIEIYEGDIIQYYIIKFWEQRSYPEYVDCSGYTIKRITKEVIFHKGIFGIKEVGVGSFVDDLIPLIDIIDLFIRRDIPTYRFDDEGGILIKTDEDGDELLVDCEEKEIKNLTKLEVIGNIYENKELLTND